MMDIKYLDAAKKLADLYAQICAMRKLEYQEGYAIANMPCDNAYGDNKLTHEICVPVNVMRAFLYEYANSVRTQMTDLGVMVPPLIK